MKRYETIITQCIGGEQSFILVEAPDGEWVKHEDHLASVADIERQLNNYKGADNEWEEKTRWVQNDSCKRFDYLTPWGKHRADVMREHIEHLEARIVTLERETAEAMEVVREANTITERATGKFASLVAENAALKESERELDETCAGEFGPNWISNLTETPSTDAYLAEVRAQGVEMFGDHLRKKGSNPIVCKMIALGADEFAAQLRQEAAK